MYCKNCGTNVPGEGWYCPNCGAPLKRKKNIWKVIVGITRSVMILAILGVGIFFFLYAGPKETEVADRPAADKEESEDTGLGQTEQEEMEKAKTESFFYTARPFSCERAWVQEEKDGIWKCIDPTGKEVFALEQGQYPQSDFQNGVSVIDNEFVINVDGEVVSSVNDGMYTSIVDDFYDNGYVFVQVYKNTVEETSEKTGIIGPDGNWWLEPVLESFYDVGNGIYEVLLEGETKLKLYDLYENEFIEETELVKRLLSRNYSEDGLIFIWQTSWGTNRFTGDAKRSFNVKEDLGFESDVTGFYNREGKLVVDLSEYFEVDPNEGFSDGFCVISILNDQRSRVYTVIVDEGNQMFGPISFEDQGWTYGGFSNGLLCYSVNGENGCRFMDTHGEDVLQGIHPVDGCEFDEEGLMRVNGIDNRYYDGTTYMNTKGEIAF